MADSTVIISIDGMTCDHCVKSVTDALKDVEGVRDVKVSLEEKKAEVIYEDSKCKSMELQAVIDSKGYSARMYGTDPSAS